MLSFGLLSTSAGKGAPRPAVEEALLPRIAQGDRDALAALYRQTSQAVYGFILSMIPNRQEAEDLLQETYLQIYRHAGAYRAQDKPMAWVLTIARNLALMRLRTVSREQPTPEEALPQPAAGNDLQAAEDHLLLQAALQRLGEEERQVVLLHAVAGLRHRESAALLGLPLSTVLSRYARALRKLRGYLSEGGLEP